MKKVLLLLVAISIIYFSNTPNLEVSNVSTWINEPKFEKEVTNLNFITEINSDFYRMYGSVTHIDFILHKVAHVIFYSMLTYLLFINLNLKKKKFLITWMLVTFFALTDEIHQFFVVGRSGRMADVILDSTASIIFLITLYLVKKLHKKRC